MLERAEPAGRASDVRPAVRNRGVREDGAATVVLDFGARVAEAAPRAAPLRRQLPSPGGGRGRRRRTGVDDARGRGMGLRRARERACPLRGRGPARERLPPAAGGRAPGAGRDGAAGDRGAFVPGRREASAPRGASPPCAGARRQDAARRETWLTLDLGARHQPFEAVVLEVADERFFREVRVEARRDPRGPGGAVSWEEIGRGQVHRLEHEGRRRECLRIEVRGRERALRLRVRNRDDRPLRVTAVAVLVPGRTAPLRGGGARALPPDLRLGRSSDTVLRPGAHGGGSRRLGGDSGRRDPRPAPATGGGGRRRAALDRAPPRAPLGGSPGRGRWRSAG